LRNVLIIDPKGVIAKGGTQTLDRHLLYAKKLGVATRNKFRLIIITKSENQNVEAEFDNLLLINISSNKLKAISFALAIRKRLKGEYIELMVVGDPWESFYTGLLTRFFIEPKIPIQVQLHADLYSEEWLRGSFSNRIKSVLSLPALRISKSVRFVSHSQLANGLRKFRWLKEKSFVAPVYLNKPVSRLHKSQKNFHDPITLGVLGRIHQDRGLDKLVPLISPIIQAGIKIRVLIAGEGPYKNNLEDQTETLGISDYFTYLGHISGEQLDSFWRVIDVFVSLAPSESYGRSIREALLAGVPIWVLPSSGALELESLVKSGGGSYINLELDPREQVSSLQNLLKLSISREIKEEIASQNEQGIKNLIDSWIGISGRIFKRSDI
jgi:glycosyltransferase involved in cell wall biosynthesis